MKITEFVMPPEIKKLISDLREKGIKAYPVGGCVRDSLLGKTPLDYDMTAETVPEKLAEALMGYHFVETGIKYGTLTVIAGDYPVEVTCCRSDGEYFDNRRPDTVVYTENLKDDLSRRDFTVNAIAYSEDSGYIDPFGGITDIENGIIRAVGDARVRFSEDALRILRAVRFSSVLGFKIEKNTASAIHEMKNLINNVASERIYAELKKLICGKNVFFVLMEFSDVMCEIIPELAASVGFSQNNPHHQFSVYEHIARSVAKAPERIDVRLAMLFHDIGKPAVYTEDENGIGHFKGHQKVSAELTEVIMKRLRADNEMTDKVVRLVKYHDERPELEKRCIKRYVMRVGEDIAREILTVRRSDTKGQKEVPDSEALKLIDLTEAMLDEIDREDACMNLKKLAVRGDDLIALGISPGKKIGEILNALLLSVVNEEIENEKETLLKEAAKLK